MHPDNENKAEFMVALAMEYAKVYYPENPNFGAVDVINKINRQEDDMEKKLKAFVKERFNDYIKGGNEFEL